MRVPRLEIRPVAARGTWDATDPSTATRPHASIECGAKAALDLVLTLLLVVVALPVVLVAMAAIVVIDRQAPVYCDERVGLGGRRFRCFKLRTMRSTPGLLERYLADHPDESELYERTRKLTRDPRTTTTGRLLRKASIDELPQLINVLLRQMSLVGPRPITPSEIRVRAGDTSELLRVRPGLTGLWQVSGRSRLTPGERDLLDSRYVESWSLILDLKLLLLTPFVVLTAHGAQ